MKNLVVVYKEKNDDIINYLNLNTDSENDSLENGVTVEYEEDTENEVKMFAWDEKTWLKKKITMRKELQESRILFLDNIFGVERIKPSLDLKFHKFGVFCGLIDNIAVISVNQKELEDMSVYNTFIRELKNLCNTPLLKRTVKHDNVRMSAEETFILTTVSLVFPVMGEISSISKYLNYSFDDSDTVKKQQLLYGVVRLYKEYLDNFMDGNPSITAELKEVINENKALKAKICGILKKIGSQKIKCYDKELRTFLDSYEKIQNNTIGKKVIDSLTNLISPEDRKSIDRGITKLNELSDKVHIRDRESIPWALFGTNAKIKHLYTDKKDINRTVMYLTYSLFEIDKKYLKKDATVFNGKVIDELLYASVRFPIKRRAEVTYKNGMKSEEYRQSLYFRFKDFNKIQEDMILELEELSEALFLVESKLSIVNDLMTKMEKLENDSSYVVKLSREIISDGIITMKDLVEIADSHLFEDNGTVSFGLLRKIKQKDFISRVALVKSRDEFEKYYNKYEDAKKFPEEELSDLNIMIVFSKEFDVKARYYQYYQNQDSTGWEEIQESSPLRYDERYLTISKDKMEDLINQLGNATALGDCRTSIFYVGDQQIFSDLKSSVESMFSNVIIFFKE